MNLIGLLICFQLRNLPIQEGRLGHFPACFSWNHFSQHGLWVPRTVQLIKIRKKYDANITIICRLYHYRISQSENNMMIICFERRTRECKCSLKWESVAAGLVWQEENGRWVWENDPGQTLLRWLRESGSVGQCAVGPCILHLLQKLNWPRALCHEFHRGVPVQ